MASHFIFFFFHFCRRCDIRNKTLPDNFLLMFLWLSPRFTVFIDYVFHIFGMYLFQVRLCYMKGGGVEIARKMKMTKNMANRFRIPPTHILPTDLIISRGTFDFFHVHVQSFLKITMLVKILFCLSIVITKETIQGSQFFQMNAENFDLRKPNLTIATIAIKGNCLSQ